jgi:hypothetical protein
MGVRVAEADKRAPSRPEVKGAQWASMSEQRVQRFRFDEGRRPEMCDDRGVVVRKVEGDGTRERVEKALHVGL